VDVTLFWLYTPRPPQSPNRAISLWWDTRCPNCFGQGWFAEVVAGTEDDYIPDHRERFCDCEAGRWRRVADGWTEAELGEWYVELLAILEAELSPS
jgi:hypothetical protein